MIKNLLHHNLQLLVDHYIIDPNPYIIFFSEKKQKHISFLLIHLESVVGRMTWFWVFLSVFLPAIEVLLMCWVNYTTIRPRSKTKTQCEEASWTCYPQLRTVFDSDDHHRSNLMHLNLDLKLRPFHLRRLNHPLHRLCSTAWKAQPSSEKTTARILRPPHSVLTAKGCCWYHSLETEEIHQEK